MRKAHSLSRIGGNRHIEFRLEGQNSNEGRTDLQTNP
jgi:hypothetical protein